MRNCSCAAATLRVATLVTAILNFFAPSAIDAQDARSKQLSVEYFERKVRPLLARHCYECHSTAEGPDNGELILDTAAGIRQGGSRGVLVQNESSKDSLLWTAVNYAQADLEMPPSGKLAARDLDILRTWIEGGFPLPKSNGLAPRQNASIDFEAGRNFWSFRQLSNPTVPDVEDSHWCRNEIDRFVLARLERAGLTPSAPAADHTLLRRLTFDLNGLPPSEDSARNSRGITQPDRWQAEVERLLSSPRYGERWGRTWLDLARYTDTTASWLNSTGQAWLYRDWVIAALNRNLPFDEFVKLQLAADLSPGTAPEDLAALGFLGLSPTYWKELKLSPEVIRQVVAEEWDERIDAVSRSFLGLTVSCARCHDHKFDPISSEDYYGLAGVFASTQLSDRLLIPADEATVVLSAREQVAKLEQQLQKLKDKESAEAGPLKEKIAAIKAKTPQYDAASAHAVREAAIYVHPKGEDATRLEYKDGATRDLGVFRRGNPANATEPVPRRYLTVLSPSKPVPFQRGSGRLELADAITGESEALVARVIVNRIWTHHFGFGLVRTPSNFGMQGELPTHPELLEYLASELVRHEWDLKWLHRLIVNSSTWRQLSNSRETPVTMDPENRLLWRMNRRRLDVEMWRDAVLVSSASLRSQIGGPAENIDAAINFRRTVYGKIARRELNVMMRTYDFPEPTSHSPRREPTTTPLQQLYVLNAPLFRAHSSRLVGLSKKLENEDRIALMYLRLFGRTPTSEEVSIGQAFVNSSGEQPNDPESWTDYVHSLMGLNEFFYLD